LIVLFINYSITITIFSTESKASIIPSLSLSVYTRRSLSFFPSPSTICKKWICTN